jgi:hypothetical protein
VKLYGLMITKDDHDVFGDWCRDQLALYDAVVCLDGSAGRDTERLAARFPDRLVYLNERDHRIAHKTDHGLRDVVHREIASRFGFDNWVMCCHADEFCYHDPRKVAARAEREGYDAASWYSLHFYPHPSELPDWVRRMSLPVWERFRHYHWDHCGSGRPWREDRLYRNGPRVGWDGITHGSVRPHGLVRPAPFHPALRHYKVTSTNLAAYEPSGPNTFYRSHWAGLRHRTGLPFPANCPEDLFVAAVPGYECCDRFDGTLPHPWNMGEEYRPTPPLPISDRMPELLATATQGERHAREE